MECPCTGNSFAFDALKESEGKAGLPIGLAVVDLLHRMLPRLEHLLNLLPQEVDVPLGETGGKFMAGVVKSITIQSRPQRWSYYEHDGMVNGFCQSTIGVDGFSMVFVQLDHCH